MTLSEKIERLIVLEQDNLELDRAELKKFPDLEAPLSLYESVAFRKGKIETYQEALTLLKRNNHGKH